jgi:hypothetical protein
LKSLKTLETTRGFEITFCITIFTLASGPRNIIIFKENVLQMDCAIVLHCVGLLFVAIKHFMLLFVVLDKQICSPSFFNTTFSLHNVFYNSYFFYMVISTFSKTHFLIFHVNSQHIQNLKIE